MKDTLKKQLDTYKFDNSKHSKEALLDSLSSLKGATIGDRATSAVENAKEALNSTTSNKSKIVNSVEDVIKNLS
ncbi:hypothetical protein [Tissierella creatinophila]|uniref:Uncharacterized protein n=1 Tax=Tissierella creatinophila DSM 6911 TaxID=1123403 RepID=A0A1U7M744_TISCR|nr:hypothetical protein [Tissierella creatinophila]OLS03154.1 hypothetical protein TICRE_08550 [Tissierella creatinophila DSM 6911]